MFLIFGSRCTLVRNDRQSPFWSSKEIRLNSDSELNRHFLLAPPLISIPFLGLQMRPIPLPTTPVKRPASKIQRFFRLASGKMCVHFRILCTPVSSCKHKQAIKTFNKWASWCEAKYKRKRHCHCGIFGIGSVGSVRGEAGLMAESTEQYNHYTNLLTAESCAQTRSRHLRSSTSASGM